MKTYVKSNELGLCEDQSNSFFEVDGVPDGWAEVPEHLLGIWEKHKPFVTIDVANGMVLSMAESPSARVEWIAAHPVLPPDPTPEEDRDALLVELAYQVAQLQAGGI